MGEAGDNLPNFTQPHDERVLEGSRACCRVALSIPEAGAVGVASDEGVLRVYNERGEQYKRIEAHYGRITGVVSIGEGVVLTTGFDGKLRAWQLKDTREPIAGVNVPETGRQQPTCTALFAFGSSWILVGTGGGDLVLYDWDAQRRDQPLQALGHVPNAHGKRINSIHGHGDLFVTSSNDSTVAVWTSADFERQEVFQHQSRVFAAAIGDSYILSSVENSVILYRNSREEGFPKVAVVPVPCGVIWTLRFTRPNLVMVCGDGVMNFLDTEKQRLIARVRTGAINIIDADFLPNGDAVLAGNGRESNVIVSLPSDLTVPAKSIDTPSQYVIDPRLSDGKRDPRDRDPRRRNSEPSAYNYSRGNGTDADDNVDGRKDYRSDYNARRSYEPRSDTYDYSRRQRPEFRDYGRDSYRGGEGKWKPYVDSRSQYFRYDVNFEYDADRRRNQSRRDEVAGDRERERERDRDERDNRGYRSDSRYYEERRDDRNYREQDERYYERSNGNRSESDYKEGNSALPRDRLSHENGNGTRQHRSPNGSHATPGDLRNSLDANRRRRSHSQESVDRHAVTESVGQNTGVKSEPKTGAEATNVKEEAIVTQKVEVEEKEVEVNPSRSGECSEQNVHVEATSSDRRTVAEEPSAMSADGRSMTGSVHVDAGAADTSVRKLVKWSERGVSKGLLKDLENGDVAECMAAFMLRYRLSWVQKFEALHDCLLKYFNDNLLTVDDLFGEHAIDSKELTESIACALKKDSAVGAKMGLINGIERFLDALRKDD